MRIESRVRSRGVGFQGQRPPTRSDRDTETEMDQIRSQGNPHVTLVIIVGSKR